LEVWGDGSAERDFLHADDAARAVVACLAGSEQ
jgi:nucleoside-diphosphate-sugar epimerase